MESSNIIVVFLTQEQKDLLHGKYLQPNWRFNAMFFEDLQKWWIGTEQQENCTNEEFSWVKDLPISEYELKAPAIPTGCPPEDLHLYTTGSL